MKGGTQERLTGWSFGSLQDILLGGVGGDISFHLQPIHAQVGAFLPQGCPYLVSGLQPSKLFPQAPASPPQLPFPRSPPSHSPHRNPASPWLWPRLGPLIQTSGLEGRDSLPYLGRLLKASYGLEPSGLKPPWKLGPVPASLAAGGRRGSAATSPHEAQPMRGRHSSSPGYSQSHSVPHQLLSRLRGEDGVFD